MNPHQRTWALDETAHLEAIQTALHPRCIAVAGASGDPRSMGYRYLLHFQTYGFSGRVYPVTAKWPEILGYKTYPRLRDLPEDVDLVIGCLPAAAVPEMLEDSAAAGARVVHLFTGRFSETGDPAAQNLEKRVQERAWELGLRLIGPNCMGLYHPAQGLSFTYDLPSEPGRLGMFLQSGGASAEFVLYAAQRGVRFSKLISYGNALDINEADLLDYLARDDETELIAGYVEGVQDGRRFFQVLQAACRKKPVILLKAGRGRAGAQAAASHTASLAGSLKVWRAALAQAGAIEARSLEDMIDLAVAFYFLPPITGRRVGIVGGGGGRSVLSADEWEEAGFSVPPFTTAIEERIRAIVPELWWGWIRNPVDMSLMPPQAQEANLGGEVLKMMADSDGFDLAVANFSMGGPHPSSQLAQQVARWSSDVIEAGRTGRNPVVAILNTGTLSPEHFNHPRWRTMAEALSRLTQAGLPVYPCPSQAAGAIHRLTACYARRAAQP
jgi:acyl-CoA synthetase (NDP forming)